MGKKFNHEFGLIWSKVSQCDANHMSRIQGQYQHPDEVQRRKLQTKRTTGLTPRTGDESQSETSKASRQPIKSLIKLDKLKVYKWYSYAKRRVHERAHPKDDRNDPNHSTISGKPRRRFPNVLGIQIWQGGGIRLRPEKSKLVVFATARDLSIYTLGRRFW